MADKVSLAQSVNVRMRYGDLCTMLDRTGEATLGRYPIKPQRHQIL